MTFRLNSSARVARETLGSADRWFARLPQRSRDFVQAHVSLRHFPDRARVYSAGDAGDGLYRVIDGEVRLMAYPAVGREMVTFVARGGHWFGELSVIDHGPRPHDAVCHGPVSLLHLPASAIAAHAEGDPAFIGQVALIGCDHQRAALAYIGSMTGRPGRERMAGMILAMAGPDPRTPHPVLQMSQEDLAGRVGLSRQHLGNLLSELKEGGVISLAYGRLEVLDPERLAQHAGRDSA